MNIRSRFIIGEKAYMIIPELDAVIVVFINHIDYEDDGVFYYYNNSDVRTSENEFYKTFEEARSDLDKLLKVVD